MTCQWLIEAQEYGRVTRPNRETSRSARLGTYWCFKCDAALVYVGQKCPNCGHREKRARKKT